MTKLKGPQQVIRQVEADNLGPHVKRDLVITISIRGITFRAARRQTNYFMPWHVVLEKFDDLRKDLR